MFERFTNQARHVVVLAQEEAKGLQHGYIGTEHLLLALVHEGEGLAAQVLARFDMPLEAVRAEVRERVGVGKTPAGDRIPFTPRAKKVLELALREARSLQHGHIGSEHLLLGLVREGNGVAAHILRAHAGDLLKVRMAVLDLLPAVQPVQGRWLRRRPAGMPWPASETIESAEPGNRPLAPGEAEEEMRTTPAADMSLAEARRLAGAQPVGSHHLLLAALADQESAAARALAGLGLDLGKAREALRQADVAGTSDEPPEEAGRRHMVIRLADDHLTLEASDPALAALARAALKALGDRAAEPGTIPGDLPFGASLGQVWQALRNSLEDIARRAPAGES